MADPSVARRIRLRRQALRLSQQQLADLLGVSRNTVSRWERGLHGPDKHEGPLEDVLGISLSPSPPEDPPDPFEAALLALGIARADVRDVTAKFQPAPVRQSA